LNASFGTAISQCHNTIFYAKIDDRGIRQENTGQIFAQWQFQVASKVALYMLHQAMNALRIAPAHQNGHQKGPQ
jgi:hypothetical protein